MWFNLSVQIYNQLIIFRHMKTTGLQGIKIFGKILFDNANTRIIAYDKFLNSKSILKKTSILTLETSCIKNKNLERYTLYFYFFVRTVS